MGKISVETCHIEGLKVITPQVFGDARGYFMETYNYNCLLYTSPSPRDGLLSRMPSSA